MLDLSALNCSILGFLPKELKETSLMLFGEGKTLQNDQLLTVLLFLFLSKLDFNAKLIQIILQKFSEKLKKALEEGLSGGYAGALQILDNRFVSLNGFDEIFDLDSYEFVDEIKRPPIFSVAVSIDGLIAEIKDLLV